MTQEVVIERHLSRAHNVLAARARFTPLFVDYLAHSRQWVGDPDGLVGVMMRQGLAAGALYLTCRPRDEQTAWTFNFPEPPLNVFITCDAGRGRVTGRYFDAHVKSTARNRLFVQTIRRIGEPYTSAIEVTGFDILRILEQYYLQSEQATTRFCEGDDDEYVMLMALPGIDEEWIRNLPREEALAFPEWPQMRPIEQRRVGFACMCDEGRILQIVSGMFHDRRDELFGADPEVEVRCPRCGRAYQISRADFDRALRERPPEVG